MTARRRPLAAASAALALVALTACEKPAPIVTLVSGGTSIYSEAATFCFDEAQVVPSGECAGRAKQVQQLAVRPGEQLGIDVDKELVDRGWQVKLSDPRSQQDVPFSQVHNKHYVSYAAPAIQPGAPLVLTVRTVADDQSTGEWIFELVPKQ